MQEYEEIVRQKGLPQVGQLVRSKKYGTIWRVLEKREVWQPLEDDPVTQEPRWTYAIFLNYWQVKKGEEPGTGRTMGFLYTLEDKTFQDNWEIVR